MAFCRSLAVLASLATVSSLAACGGVAATDDASARGGTPGGGNGGSGNGSSGGSSDGSSGGSSTAFDVVGSFDLAFTSVDVTQKTGPTPPGSDPPSRKVRARLDIRKSPTSAAGYDAVLTGRWGESAAYSVSVAADALTLTGSGAIAGGTPSGFVGDTWRTLVLARDASGRLTGAVSASGDETISEGDQIWNAKITGAATIVRDATDPELRAEISGLAGSAGLLPWEPIALRAAEPVGADALEQATRVTASDPSGKTLALRWDALAPRPESWAGATRVVAHAADWTQIGSASYALLGDGARDLVGRAAKPLASPLGFVPLPGATQTVDFNSDTVFATLWGTYAIYGGGLAGSTDPRCEAGGCARLGPAQLTGCALAPSGFATQLQRLPLGHVELRYRVLAKPQFDTGPVYLYGDVVTLELAAPNAAAIDDGVNGSAAGLTKLATPIDGMTYAGAWTTLDAAAPGSGPIGVAVALGGNALARGGCGGGGPPLPPVDVEILVETVRAK